MHKLAASDGDETLVLIVTLTLPSGGVSQDKVTGDFQPLVSECISLSILGMQLLLNKDTGADNYNLKPLVGESISQSSSGRALNRW